MRHIEILKGWWKKQGGLLRGVYPPQRLLKAPRHQAGSLIFQGRPFWYGDPFSLYWSWKEIFWDEVYRFPCSKGSPRIIDAGANLGLATLFFLQKYPGCKVTALEPDPKTFAWLEKNLSFWGDQKNPVQLLCAALAGSRGPRQFEDRGGDAGRLGKGLKDSDGLQVKCIVLDDLLDEPVDFLKMDLEGAETEVLESSQNLGQVEFLFVEHHSFAHQSRTLERVLRCLTSAGFCYWLKPQFAPARPWEKIEMNEGMDLQVNIFARNMLR